MCHSQGNPIFVELVPLTIAESAMNRTHVLYPVVSLMLVLGTMLAHGQSESTKAIERLSRSLSATDHLLDSLWHWDRETIRPVLHHVIQFGIPPGIILVQLLLYNGYKRLDRSFRFVQIHLEKASGVDGHPNRRSGVSRVHFVFRPPAT